MKEATSRVDQTPKVRGRRRGLYDMVLLQKSITPLAFLVIFAAYYFWLGNTFLDGPTLLLTATQNVSVLMLGLAVVVTLIVGQFDLSVASVASMANLLTIGLCVQQGWSLAAAIVASMLVGVGTGLLNGFLVVRLRVNAFIATLGTGGIIAGLDHVYCQGGTITPDPSGVQLPEWFSGPGSLGDINNFVPGWIVWLFLLAVMLRVGFRARSWRPRLMNQRRWDITVVVLCVVIALTLTLCGVGSWVNSTSWILFVLLAVATVLWVLVDLTVYGRNLRATGSNKEAARLAGVPVQFQTVSAFVIGGFVASLAGIIFAALQGSAPLDSSVSFLLPAFAAAFLSTVVFSSGAFTVWGTVLGGTFLSWVAFGLILGGLPFTWTDVVNGVVLLCAVALATVKSRKRT